MAKKIIAIIGMAGSGKTEAVLYLEEKYGWPKIYFPESLFEAIKKSGKEINWQSEKYMRAHLRQLHGKAVFAKLALPKIIKLLKANQTVILESLYSWDEYKLIKNKYKDNFIAITIYASPDKRFKRLNQRKIRPIKTRHELQDRDWHEIEATEKGGPIAIADYTILNHGNLKELYKNLDAVIKNISKN